MNLSNDPVSIATALAEARLNGAKLDVSAILNPPQTLKAAYAIQDEIPGALGLSVAGWKIGATSPESQKMLGIDRPFYGPLFDKWIYPAPVAVPSPDQALNKIEAEFAFHMACDLPARDTDYCENDIARAVEALYPAIEIVDTRLNPFPGRDACWLIADGAANHALCYGKGLQDWQSLDLAELGVSVLMDGKDMGSGKGSATLGSPFKALCYLVWALNKNGKGIKAGQRVTTGVVAPVFEGRKGARIIADFEALGPVEITL